MENFRYLEQEMSEKDLFLIKLAKHGLKDPEYAKRILPILRKAGNEFTEAKLKRKIRELKKDFSPYLAEDLDTSIPQIDTSKFDKTAYHAGTSEKVDKWAYFHAKEYLKESNKLAKEYEERLHQMKIKLLEDLEKNEEEAEERLRLLEEDMYKGDQKLSPKEKKQRKKEFLKELNQPVKREYKQEVNRLKNEHGGRQKDLRKDYQKRHPQFKVALARTKGNKFFGRVFLGVLFLMFLRILFAL